MITLYSSDGSTERVQINKFTYSGTFMGECYVTATINSPTPIGFDIGDYFIYRGERFELNYIPSVLKQATSGSYGSAFVYENVKFNFLGHELSRCSFLDIVLGSTTTFYSSLPTVDFYANSVQDLADRIQANLNRIYTGDKAWTVVVVSGTVSSGMQIALSSGSVWDALLLVHDSFGLHFTIRDRTIIISDSDYVVSANDLFLQSESDEFVLSEDEEYIDLSRDVSEISFSYGKGNGLKNIEQNADQNTAIRTRFRVYGSTKNMPRRYYNQFPGVDESLYIPNLMLPDFPETQPDPELVYIDSSNISIYGIREGNVYFDGSNDNEEIYPTLEGMTASQLAAAGISVSLPSGDNGNLDEVLGADNPEDSGEIPETGSIEESFTLYLKDIGFDLSAQDEDGNYIYAAYGETIQVSMKSGMCAGRTFDVTNIEKQVNSVGIVWFGYTRYVLTCNREQDDDIWFAFPNSTYKIDAEDEFVLLGTGMPDVYIEAAAQRLLEAGQIYLASNEQTVFTYTPSIDDIFLARNSAIANGIKEGVLLRFHDDDLNIDTQSTIQNLTITEGESLIPKYEVTLADELTSQTLAQKISSIVNQLISNKSWVRSVSGVYLIKRYDSTIASDTNAYSAIRADYEFLKKKDIRQGRLTNMLVRSVSVEFTNPFSWADIIIGNVRVFRYSQYGTKFIRQDVLHYFTSEAWFDINGFSLMIDESENINGVIVEYEFKKINQ